MRSVSRRDERSVTRPNAGNSKSASVPEITSQQTTAAAPAPVDSSELPVVVDVGNGFVAVTSSHFKNSRRNFSRGVNGPPFQRGNASRGRGVRGGAQYGNRQPGIQPLHEGQAPTSLRSHGNALTSNAPLFPLRPMQFPLPDYEFRLACPQCFKEDSHPVDVSHTCREDFLIVCRTKTAMRRWRLIREPKNPYGVKNYVLCRNIANGVNCLRGDSCWYAHNQDECILWNLQNGGAFRIDDFVASNRTRARPSRFTLEAIFSKHPGTLEAICKVCYRNNRCFEPQNLKRERCSKELHDLKSSRVLAHRDMKTGRVITLVDSRPFKTQNAFFNYCRYGKYCRKNVRCSFAHNVIEYDLWYVQRDGNFTEEQILERWQELSGALKCPVQRQRKWNTTGRSASESQTDSVVPSYSSVAARKLSTSSESAAGAITRCPFLIVRACAICIHAGHLTGRRGDRCERGHFWDFNKSYVALPAKKEVRGIPQQIARRRRAKFYLCKMAKRDCRYGSQCQRAHNENELQLWTWMSSNNVISLESIVQSNETQTPSSTSASTFTQRNGVSAPSVSASGEGSWFPPFQQAQWICDFCSYSCNSQGEYLRHSSTVTHQFNVNSDKEHQWNFRQPPWNVRCGLYRLCPKHEQGTLCRYSHVPQNRNYCTFAHSSDELDEWKERFKWREMKKKAAQEDNLYSYMAKLNKEYKESGCLAISEEIDDVSAECSEPLSVTSDNKLKVKEWTFQINSDIHDLHTVALLQEEGFLHFALIGEDLEESCQIADGETFQTKDTEYKVKVRFTGGMFGSFRQWVVFDFGLRPVLVRKLSIELGQEVVCDKLLSLKEEMKFNRWTSLNREIVKFGLESMDDFAVELLAQYKEPNVEAIKLTQTPLNVFNYTHRMHSLIDLEELAQAKIISTSSQFDVMTLIEVTNCISDEWGGMLFSQSGQLFARVNLDTRLLEGSLISSSSVSTALIGPKNSTAGGIVYEANICRSDVERVLKGRNFINLTLSKRCCEEMKLKNGDKTEAEIQFQLDRLTFCRMHYGIDRLSAVDIIFADSKHITQPSAWCPKYCVDLRSSELNEDQKKVISYVSFRNQRITWPLVVYGPFGTGKTKTLAEAAFLLTSQNKDAKILICAWTNHAADEYVLRYFLPTGCADIGLLRIYDKSRRINTVDPLMLPFCLLSHPGSPRGFREPTISDIQSRRIVVTTLEMSLAVTRLNLRGHFTHIFVDEAAQALECHTVMPLCLADDKTCVVLAGDHIQMTQQVHSEEAASQNFNVSLVERMVSSYFRLPQPKKPLVLFGSNYRNHPEIVKFVGRVFYGGEGGLRSVGKHAASTFFPPLAFCATQDGREVQYPSSTSFYNTAEIYEVVEQVNHMLCNWPAEWGERRPAEVLVTAPYADQVSVIRQMFKRHRNPDLAKVSVLNVLNVPGKEFRAVFISTVRTIHLLDDLDPNEDLSYGFLSDEKLLNSALTRARSSVTVIGDPIALCGIGRCCKIWREYLKHCARLNSVTPRSLSVSWIRLRVTAMTRSLSDGRPDEEEESIRAENQPQDEDWEEDFQLPEDEITLQLRN